MKKINFLINQTFLFLIFKYITYFIQFILVYYLAIKLDLYYFGVWSFILLILSYFQIFNLGISNSTAVLLIKHKQSAEMSNKYISNGFLLILLLNATLIFLGILFYFLGSTYLEKFDIKNQLIFIVTIAILFHLNSFFMTVFRIKNFLGQITFFQFIIPFLTLLSALFLQGKTLLYTLISIYLLGHLISFFIFKKSNLIKITLKKIINKNILLNIIKKGIFLFLFNFTFQLLLISMRSIVSLFFSVNDFGVFSFSFQVSNSILLLFEGFIFLIFPKIIDKFITESNLSSIKLINDISICYSVAISLTVYLSLIFFPFAISIFPKYNDALLGLNIASIAILFQSKLMGFNAFLISKNKEKLIFLYTFLALILNIIIGLIIVLILKLSFNWIYLSLIFTYFFLSICYSYSTFKILKNNYSLIEAIKHSANYKMFLPVFSAFFVFNNISHNFNLLLFLPFLLFVILNLKEIFKMLRLIVVFLNNPDILKINSN